MYLFFFLGGCRAADSGRETSLVPEFFQRG
jgi:hypothetical protein